MSEPKSTADSARRVRRLLTAAYVAAAAACVGLPAWFSYLEYQVALEAVTLQTTSYARALDEHVNRAIANAELTLESTAEAIAAAGGLTHADPALLHEQLRARAERLPEISTMFAYDATLTLHAHSRERTPPPRSGADFEHVTVHRDKHPAGLFIGRPVIGPATGLGTVPLTIALRAPEGSLQGVLGAALDLRYFDHFYRSLQLPADAAVLIARADGVLLVRYPAGGRVPGASLAAHPVMALSASGQREGRYESRVAEGGVVRLAAWRRHPERPLIFIVSRTRDGALAPWRATLPKRIAVAVAALLAVTLLAFALRREEEARRLADERSGAFFRASPSPHSISRLSDGTYVAVNEAWCRMIGYSEAEAVGRSALQLGVWMNPEAREGVIARLKQRGAVSRLETRWRRKDGMPVVALYSATVIELGGERLLLNSSVDITAERAAETALRASEQRFSAFFRSSPAAHAMARLGDGAYIEFSEGWLRMFRMRREDVEAKPVGDAGYWVQPEARAGWFALLERDGRASGQPAQLRRRDGEVFNARLSGELIDLDGERYVLGSVVDVSAETGQRRAEARLAGFFRSSPLAHSIVDFESNRYVEVNEAFERVFGIPRAEAIGRTGVELGTWPEDADIRWFEPAVSRPGEVIETRTRRKRRGGEVFDAAVSTTVVEVDGRMLRISSLRDISADVRAEAALRASEERLATFLRTSPVAHSIYDLDEGRVVDVNAAWARMFGFSREEALAATRGSEGGWIDPAAYDSLNEEVSRTGSVRDLPGTRRRKNGQVFDVRVSAERIVIAGKRFRITSIVDVSGEMRAREALERLAAYFRLSPAALVVSRLDDGRLVEVNEAYERISGFARGEVIGRTGLEVGFWPSPEVREKMVARLRAGRRAENQRLTIPHKTGGMVEVLFSAERIEFGGVAHIVSSAIDITEQERARQALARSEMRFETFFRASPVALMISERDSGRCLSVNEAYERMMRFAPGEAIGLTAAQRNTWTDEATRKAFVDEATGTGRASRRTQLRRRDGNTIDVHLSMEALQLDEERLFLVAIVDLTTETRAMEAVRRSEERFARFFRSSPAAHALVRLHDGRYLEVNDAHSALYGYAREEIVGRGAIELGIWVDDATRAAYVRTLLREGSVRRFRARARAKDGREFEIYNSAEVVELDGARHILSSSEDATEELRVREALERLAVYFRLSPAALIISRLDDARYVEVNEAYERMFGYSREEVLGVSSIARGVWADPADRERIARTLRDGGRVTNHSMRVRRKDGSLIDVLFSAERMDLDGVPHLLTSVVDVTETERARRALADSEARFARLFRSNPHPQVISEVESGRLRDVNDAWVRLFGHSREEAVGQTARTLETRVHPEDRDRYVNRVLSEGRIEHVALKARHKSGEVFDAVHSAELIELGGERLILTSIRDASAEMAARTLLEDAVRERTAELEASNRELESFSYSVSHDMRAPIRAISSYAEILRSAYGAVLDEEARQVLDRIARAGGHLGGLVDALLDLSRLMRTSLEHAPVDLGSLARQIVAGLREREPARVVEFSIAPDLRAEADPVLARSLLENLLGNAWKYTARAQTARIEFGREGDAFFVRDNGVGFDMAYAGKLFKPFERLHRAGEFPGTGIGLATVERIVRRHHGTVRATAVPNEGATFYFTLPH